MTAVQPLGVPGALPVFAPTGQTTASQDATSATDMLHGQFSGPVEQTVSSKKSLFAVSLNGANRLRTWIWIMTVSLPPLARPQTKRVRCLPAKAEDYDQEVTEEQTYHELSGVSGHSWGGNRCLSLSPQPVY